MLGVHRAELGTLHAEVEAMLLTNIAIVIDKPCVLLLPQAKITEQQTTIEDSLQKMDMLSEEVHRLDGNVQGSIEAKQMSKMQGRRDQKVA
eukprot:6486025-Amphidinium_carterae.1